MTNKKPREMRENERSPLSPNDMEQKRNPRFPSPAQPFGDAFQGIRVTDKIELGGTKEWRIADAEPIATR